MKKRIAVILMFDIMIGLLLFCVYGNRRHEIYDNREAGSGSVREGRNTNISLDGQDGEKTAEEQVRKKIAITFDDGPHPYYTEQLLDGLKERGVHATFFVTGEHAELHPEVIERMSEDA